MKKYLYSLAWRLILVNIVVFFAFLFTAFVWLAFYALFRCVTEQSPMAGVGLVFSCLLAWFTLRLVKDSWEATLRVWKEEEN